ncbi:MULTISPECIES: LacI family DNA-binding transcriptional regulator [Luteimonas]|uniref:LacI family transcriptional regulator n=1 Tax=Luteimonas chenhongjianii TaxID=2006110 RepID=A0A290XI75_9GAMM|nr:MULTISPECIES: LacI family DNA-binding transcriptional regulator [Luteimonas]ATD68872.1 LacI family transcriptional regulator [Luteimonas chenhongjianii]RPD88218.1 LacI family DNA-binding transcriptional regulator [Luteimonas sp. 100069]
MEKPRKSVRRKTRGVTIAEVAAHAGVSPMTISRVINNQGKVRESTRERVLSAVRELHYTPNLAASSLAAAQHTRIALVYTNPSGAYLRELLVGLLRVASATAIQLVIDYWDELDANAERKAARALAKRVDGIILPPPLCESKAAVNEFVRAGVPVVAIASGHFSDDISCVRVDEFRAAKEITEHLIQHGHTRIGCIKGGTYLSASTRRYEGFKAALDEAGIELEPALVQQGDYTYRSGLAATETLLALRKPPTAILASNDDMAAAAISVAHRRGLDVPRDLSVVGFDDSSAATTVWPELTTISQPIAAMANTAIDVLVRGIRRNDATTRVLSDHVIAHRLIVRDSVARPPRQK